MKKNNKFLLFFSVFISTGFLVFFKKTPAKDLSKATQSQMILVDQNYSFLRAPKSVWKHSNIRRSLFKNANLEEANFRDCFAFRADFSKSQLKDADFSNCDLRYADFREADLRGTDFTNALLYDARFEGAIINEKTKIVFKEGPKGTLFMKESK